MAVVDNQYPAWPARHRGIDQRPIHFQTEEDRLKFLKNGPDLNIIMGMRESLQYSQLEHYVTSRIILIRLIFERETQMLFYSKTIRN